MYTVSYAPTVLCLRAMRLVGRAAGYGRREQEPWAISAPRCPDKARSDMYLRTGAR